MNTVVSRETPSKMGVLNAAAKAPGSSTATRLTDVAEAADPKHSRKHVAMLSVQFALTGTIEKVDRLARIPVLLQARLAFTTNSASRTRNPAQKRIPEPMRAFSMKICRL